MKRYSLFAYGVICHLMFFAIFAYMAGFVGDLVVPKTIDTPSELSNGWAILVNLGLITLFGLQHSIMARPWFKRRWTKLVPEPMERSTYVLISCVVSFLLMWQWQGIDVKVWDIRQPTGRALLWGLFAAGWLLVPAVSLMINHFDLFGTRQVWLYLRRQRYTPLPFRTPMLYSRIRHPLYVGWAIAFWAAPTMTLGHALFAAAMTLYMAVAVLFEERDLVSHFGIVYRAYQRRVPAFLPRLGTEAEAPATIAATRSSVPPEAVAKS